MDDGDDLWGGNDDRALAPRPRRSLHDPAIQQDYVGVSSSGPDRVYELTKEEVAEMREVEAAVVL